jgi:hypothetical protein
MCPDPEVPDRHTGWQAGSPDNSSRVSHFKSFCRVLFGMFIGLFGFWLVFMIVFLSVIYQGS